MKIVCMKCMGHGQLTLVNFKDNSRTVEPCKDCAGAGSVSDPANGRLIDAATDVMRAQRRKGIEKYKSTLEDQHGYTVGGMIDMVAEELADGSVYIQKVREQYLALLKELEEKVHAPEMTWQQRLLAITDIIKRERGNV